MGISTCSDDQIESGRVNNPPFSRALLRKSYLESHTSIKKSKILMKLCTQVDQYIKSTNILLFYLFEKIKKYIIKHRLI